MSFKFKDLNGVRNGLIPNGDSIRDTICCCQQCQTYMAGIYFPILVSTEDDLGERQVRHVTEKCLCLKCMKEALKDG